MIRHGRPWTLCSVGEYVIGPEIVGTFLNFSNDRGELRPVGRAAGLLHGVREESIVAAPRTKLAVYGTFFAASSCLSSLFTAGFGSSPNDDA